MRRFRLSTVLFWLFCIINVVMTVWATVQMMQAVGPLSGHDVLTLLGVLSLGVGVNRFISAHDRTVLNSGDTDDE